MTSVYLAGGINGLSDTQATDWRELAKILIPRRFGVLDPMTRDYRGVEDQNVQAIVEGDLEDIRQCHYILAYCARPSWGTAMELAWSSLVPAVFINGRQVGNRKTVAVVPEGPVSPWLRHHTDAIVHSLEGAVSVIEGWAG